MAIITPKMTLRPLNSDEMTAVREEAEKWRSYCNLDLLYTKKGNDIIIPDENDLLTI